MLTFTRFTKKTSSVPARSYLLTKCRLLLAMLFAGIFAISNTVHAQGTNCGAATLIATTNAATCTPGTSFTVSGSGSIPAMSSCYIGGVSASNSWGKFVAQGPTARISYQPASNRDAMIYAYSGTCSGTLTELGCVDAGGNGTQENLSLSGLTAGTTYFFRIVRYGSTSNMNGSICVASQLTITTSAISGSPFCAGSSVSVPFTSTGTFTGNTYTAQLSDASGSFTSPAAIGTLVSDANSGTITATLPTTALGSGYRIRVIGSSPAVTGTDNGTNLTVNALPQGSLTGIPICGSGTGQLTFTASAGTGPFSVTYNDGSVTNTQTGVVSGTPFTPTPSPVSTTTYTIVSITDNNGCTRSSGFTSGTATIDVGSIPTITTASAATTVCFSGIAQNASLSYSATTGTPTNYTIIWNAAALAAGLVNAGSTALPASPITVPVAASVAAGTYTGTLYVTNASGCTSSGNVFTITIDPSPTITSSATASGVCFSSSAQNTSLSYSATSNSPVNYTITWNAAAIAAGLVNVGSTALPASPITVPVTAGVAAGTYTGTLRVFTAGGCSNAGNSFTVTISAAPTITSAAAAAAKCASSSAQNSTLTYTASTGTPTQYAITWNSAALAAGLVSLGNTAITASPLTVPIAASVTAGTYTGTLYVTNAGGCTSVGNVFTITISGTPDITNAATANAVCFSSGAQSSSLSYSATSNSPTNYTITWNAAALAAGLANVGSTALPASPITVPVAASVATGTYTGTLTVTNAGGCASAGNSFTITVNPSPTITSAATASGVCFSSSAQNSSLSYSATTNSPVNYTITWNAAAITAGLVNVGSTALPASPVTVPIAAAVPAGTYTGTLRVFTAGGCSNTGNSFTVTIAAAPSITSAAAAATKCISSSAQNSTLTYSGTSGTPTLYSITWNAAALAAGLVNLGNTAITASPLTVPIAAAVPAGTYTGTLNVTNAGGCTNAGNSFTLTLTSTPTITIAASAVPKCSSNSSQTSSLSYSSTSGSPTNYTITWDATALAAGLANVGSTALPASPITVPIAANVAGGTYNGTVRVTNAGGCASAANAFTLTINGTPTITTSATTSGGCASASAQNTYLNYSATSNSPTNYSITWSGTALAAGLVNLSSTAITSSPLTVPVAGGVTNGTYSGTVYVTNAAGCSSAGNSFNVTISRIPTITSSGSAANVCFNTADQTSTISYSGTTRTPTDYYIVWDATALAAGLVNLSTTTLTGSPLSVPVAGNTPAGTYNGTLYVSVSSTGCSSVGNAFTLTITAAPSITIAATATSRCVSSSAQTSSISYSATSGSPTRYSITWDATALAAGLVNLGNTAITGSPLSIPIAANVAPGTYNGTLSVINAAGCSSAGNAFTLTINGATITTSATAASTCYSTSARTSTLNYSATTGSPTNYTITWNAAGIAAGLINVGSTALPASPITIPVAASVTAGTYTGTLTVTNGSGCSSLGNTFTISIVALPTITNSAAAAIKCINASAQTTTLTYSASSGSPTTYSITWDATALAAGLVNLGSTAITASPLSIPVAAGVAAGTYNGTVKVMNAGGCNSTANAFTFTLTGPPTITSAATASTICFRATSQTTTLTYSATTNSPTQYAVTWDASALAAGLSNLGNTAITASPLSIPIAAGVTPGTYTGTLNVVNAGGCSDAGNTFTVTINATPTITSDAAATALCSSVSAQTSALNYSATTNAPTNYSITWNAAALSAGLVNVGSTSLPAGTIPVPIAAGVAAGTYTGTLAVTNAIGCASTGNTFTLTLTGAPGITSAASAAPVCTNISAQTSSLSYSATVNSPTNYSITWNAAAHAAGLTDVSSSALPASPIPVPVAAGVASNTYHGTITISNTSGCGSSSNSFTLIIADFPSINPSAAAADVCFSSTAQSTTLAYTAALNSPTNYSITWDASALSAGLTNLSSTAITASPLNVPIAAGVPAGTYTGTVNVTNAGGCSDAGNTFTVTINASPTIVTSLTAIAKCYSSFAQLSGLSYGATTNSPNHYTITWNAAALAAGLVNVGSSSLTSTPVYFPVAAGTASGVYTGTFTVTNSNGCASSGNSFTLTIGSNPTITTQPVDQTVCSGGTVSFSIATSGGTGVTYRWRKGNTNLCNCSGVSGVNTSTLTITGAAASNAATNYNCVVSSGSCATVISNYVTLTVNPAAVMPASPPRDIVFPYVGITSVIGSFTASDDAANNLVIRTTTSTPPSNPVDGVTYTAGTSALGGRVDHVGPGVTFTSNGLTPGTTYYYWVYGYNTGSCGTSPLYLTSAILSGNVTTATNVSCGTITTLYWGGLGSGLTGATSGTDFNDPANWSTSGSTYIASPVEPHECNSISMAVRNTTTISLSGDASVYNLTFTLSRAGRTAQLNTNGFTLTVNGNAAIDVIAGADDNSNIYIGETGSGAGVIDFRANFKLGESNIGIYPHSYLVGNVDSKITFRGDVLFGRTASFILPGFSGYPPPNPVPVPGTGTTPGTIEFDGEGLQQVLWNNNVWYDNFYNVVVGNQNRPYVKHVTGTYTPDNILNNLTINDGATVDFGTSQWIREYQGGTFTMNGSAKMIMGGDRSVRSARSTGVTVSGSNFPGGYSTMDISPTSTIEYNGGPGITQTIFGTPSIGTLTYGNLIVSNGDGAGTARKVNTSVVNVAGVATISDLTTLTLGANMVSDGITYIADGGKLDCNTRIVSGAGSFLMDDGSTLGIGSAAGITQSAASGNIQTDSRDYSMSGNYIYNSSSAQNTGDGLPTMVNNLTISNAAGVTIYAASANYNIAGTLYQISGDIKINGNTLTLNNLQRSSGTLAGSATSSVGINGTDIPLFFTNGSRVLKNLTVNTNASADLQTPLAITAGSSAGAVTVASGATLNADGNLTLKSDANGTARVAEIPVDGLGNALGTIAGDVQLERYIPAKRGWRMITMPLTTGSAPTINDAFQEGAVNTDMVYANNQNPYPGFGIHISGSSPSLGFDVTPRNNPSMLIYNRATASWSGIANTLNTTVRDYEGYMVFVRGNRATNLSLNTGAATSNAVLRSTGNLRLGNQTVNLETGSGTYTVVGNPFASTIDFRNITVSGAASSNTYVMWDPALTGSNGVGAYQYFTQTGGAGTDYEVFPGGGSYGPALSINNVIQMGQAFLVQNSGPASVTISESSKVSSSTSAVFRPVPNNSVGRISTLLSAVESDNSTTLLDGALTLYGNNFSDEINLDDAKKLLNNSENFGISTGASLYQIEKRLNISETDTIHYGMRTMKVKNYQLSVGIANLNTVIMAAYLKDNFTNTVTTLNVTGTTTYPFSVTLDAASYADSRFSIYFKEFNVLATTFTAVNAYRNSKNINVDWKVENETGIRSYEVEKSKDGSHFNNKKTVTDVSNNNRNNQYQWIDEQPNDGINYYRIKIIDANGKVKYSNIAKVMFGEQAEGITVYPNPVAEDKINLYFTAQQTGDYSARLFNSAGQLIKTVKLQQLTGNSNASIALDKGMVHGNYVLEVVKPDNTKVNIKLVY